MVVRFQKNRRILTKVLIFQSIFSDTLLTVYFFTLRLLHIFVYIFVCIFIHIIHLPRLVINKLIKQNKIRSFDRNSVVLLEFDAGPENCPNFSYIRDETIWKTSNFLNSPTSYIRFPISAGWRKSRTLYCNFWIDLWERNSALKTKQTPVGAFQPLHRQTVRHRLTAHLADNINELSRDARVWNFEKKKTRGTKVLFCCNCVA